MTPYAAPPLFGVHGDGQSPLYVDYVLIAVNDNETRALRGSLDVPFWCKSEYGFEWAAVPIRGSCDVNVAIISLNDRFGKDEGLKTISFVVRELRPTAVMVVGTAGGVSVFPEDPNEEVKIKHGDVVVSTLVQAGTFGGAMPALRAVAVAQPSPRLLETARIMATRSQGWCEEAALNELLPKDAQSEEGRGAPPVHFVDIATVDEIVETYESPLLGLLRDQFRKTRAFDMESGGVANGLWEASRMSSLPEFLVIRGISDVPKHGASAADNKSERKKWSKYASKAAAQFAFALLQEFSPRRPARINPRRLVPEGLVEGRIRQDLAAVVSRLSIAEYSTLAAHNIEREYHHRAPTRGAGELFITFCAFQPMQLMTIGKRSLRKAKIALPADEDAQIDPITQALLAEYPHFKLFQDLASKDSVECARILLVDVFPDVAERRKIQWRVFDLLNGVIPCWAMKQHLLHSLGMFEDFVIVSDSLLMNYVIDKEILFVHDPRQGIPEYAGLQHLVHEVRFGGLREFGRPLNSAAERVVDRETQGLNGNPATETDGML